MQDSAHVASMTSLARIPFPTPVAQHVNVDVPLYCDTSEHVHLQTFTETEAENNSGKACSWHELLTWLSRTPSAGGGKIERERDFDF